jgi:hypothetical protein
MPASLGGVHADDQKGRTTKMGILHYILQPNYTWADPSGFWRVPAVGIVDDWAACMLTTKMG